MLAVLAVVAALAGGAPLRCAAGRGQPPLGKNCAVANGGAVPGVRFRIRQGDPLPR